MSHQRRRVPTRALRRHAIVLGAASIAPVSRADERGRPLALLRVQAGVVQRLAAALEAARHVVEQTPVVRAQLAEVGGVDVAGVPRAASLEAASSMTASRTSRGSGACICSLVASVSVSVTA